VATDLKTLLARAGAKVAIQVAEKAAKADPRKLPEVVALRNLSEWKSVATVLLFDDWACACGASGRSPGGLFTLQEHVRLANSTRLVAASALPLNMALTRRLRCTERQVLWCAVCAPANAFRWDFSQYENQSPIHTARAEPETETPDEDLDDDE
jgi:hypothetical protein